MNPTLLVIGDFTNEQIASVMDSMLQEGLEVTPRHISLEQLRELVKDIPTVPPNDSDEFIEHVVDPMLAPIAAQYFTGVAGAMLPIEFYCDNLANTNLGFLVMHVDMLNGNSITENTWTTDADGDMIRVPPNKVFTSRANEELAFELMLLGVL